MTVFYDNFLATVAVENEKTTYADIKPGTKE